MFIEPDWLSFRGENKLQPAQEVLMKNAFYVGYISAVTRMRLIAAKAEPEEIAEWLQSSIEEFNHQLHEFEQAQFQEYLN